MFSSKMCFLQATDCCIGSLLIAVNTRKQKISAHYIYPPGLIIHCSFCFLPFIPVSTALLHCLDLAFTIFLIFCPTSFLFQGQFIQFKNPKLNLNSLHLTPEKLIAVFSSARVLKHDLKYLQPIQNNKRQMKFYAFMSMSVSLVHHSNNNNFLTTGRCLWV